MVAVLIEEMFGSDRSRPKDYRRAVVIDAGPKNKTNEGTLRSERRRALKKRLTEPTLLEMSGFGCQLNRSMQHHPMRSFDHISPGELVCLAVLGQNLARVVFRPI